MTKFAFILLGPQGASKTRLAHAIIARGCAPPGTKIVEAHNARPLAMHDSMIVELQDTRATTVASLERFLMQANYKVIISSTDLPTEAYHTSLASVFYGQRSLPERPCPSSLPLIVRATVTLVWENGREVVLELANGTERNRPRLMSRIRREIWAALSARE